jgi:hypothetical protein
VKPRFNKQLFHISTLSRKIITNLTAFVVGIFFNIAGYLNLAYGNIISISHFRKINTVSTSAKNQCNLLIYNIIHENEHFINLLFTNTFYKNITFYTYRIICFRK